MFDIRVSNFTPSHYPSVLGHCEVSFSFSPDYTITIRDVRVVRARAGTRFVALPSVRRTNDEGVASYLPLVTLDRKLQTLVSDAVLAAFAETEIHKVAGGVR